MKSNIVILFLVALLVMAQAPAKPKTVTCVSNNLYVIADWISVYSGYGFKVVTVVQQPVAIGHLSERERGNILIVMSK